MENLGRSLFGISIEAALFTSFWIAACAYALTLESCLILQTPWPPVAVQVFVFAATLCHYNVHYLFRTREGTSARDRWTALHRPWHMINIVLAGLVAVGCIIWMSGTEILIVAIATIVSLLYSLPVLPHGLRLKQFGIGKPFILAAVWAVITVWLPAHKAEAHLLFLVMLRRFTFMAALCLAFDIRDINKDHRQNVMTIPVRWGKSFTYRLIDLFLVLFLILAASVELDKGRLAVLIALSLSALVTKLAIIGSRRFIADGYYLGVVDGMMLVQAGLVMVALIFFSF
jgi:4-hydroxybenzoate polyprenyltransferase